MKKYNYSKFELQLLENFSNTELKSEEAKEMWRKIINNINSNVVNRAKKERRAS